MIYSLLIKWRLWAEGMLTIKHAINFAIKGIHLPLTPSAIQLPASLTNPYSNWGAEGTTCRIFQAFQLYLPSITATIINNDPTATDSLSQADFEKFLHCTSFPWARETLRHHASEQYLFHLLEASPKKAGSRIRYGWLFW